MPAIDKVNPIKEATMAATHRGQGFSISENLAVFDDNFLTDPLRGDICDWLVFHGFNPDIVPINCELRRDPSRFMTSATCFLKDENGRRVFEGEFVVFTALQYNEGPPLPFPGFSMNGKTFYEYREQFGFSYR